MNVVKRSEFCENKGSTTKAKVAKLGDIRRGTVFRGFVEAYSEPYVWMRTGAGVVRLGNKGVQGAGYALVSSRETSVRDYEELNATLVIED